MLPLISIPRCFWVPHGSYWWGRPTATWYTYRKWDESLSTQPEWNPDLSSSRLNRSHVQPVLPLDTAPTCDAAWLLPGVWVRLIKILKRPDKCASLWISQQSFNGLFSIQVSQKTGNERRRQVTKCWTRLFFVKASTKFQTGDQSVLVTAVRQGWCIHSDKQHRWIHTKEQNGDLFFPLSWEPNRSWQIPFLTENQRSTSTVTGQILPQN